MNINDYINIRDTEKPLDNMVSNGGLCAVFRTIACIGDSLSSGEFESFDDETGTRGYHDYFEYSWGQYIARSSGCKVYNFSKGGMTAKKYWESFAEGKDFWNTDKLCQAYIIAMGVNDLHGGQEIGSVRDINTDDYNKNADTFAGYYARIIQRIKSMQPNARFFLVTMPRDDRASDVESHERHAVLLNDMADFFKYTYVIDLHKYAPVYDKEFKEKYYLRSHMNPAGYILTARMIESYIDYIIRHNPRDFAEVGFIGTLYHK